MNPAAPVTRSFMLSPSPLALGEVAGQPVLPGGQRDRVLALAARAPRTAGAAPGGRACRSSPRAPCTRPWPARRSPARTRTRSSFRRRPCGGCRTRAPRSAARCRRRGARCRSGEPTWSRTTRTSLCGRRPGAASSRRSCRRRSRTARRSGRRSGAGWRPRSPPRRRAWCGRRRRAAPAGRSRRKGRPWRRRRRSRWRRRRRWRRPRRRRRRRCRRRCR